MALSLAHGLDIALLTLIYYHYSQHLTLSFHLNNNIATPYYNNNNSAGTRRREFGIALNAPPTNRGCCRLLKLCCALADDRAAVRAHCICCCIC